MNSKLLNVINKIRKYQAIVKELKKIIEEIEELNFNSKYYQEVNNIVKSLINEGIFFTESINDKSFDEALAYVEETVNNNFDVPLDYDENDLIEYYSGLSNEEKMNYESYDDFKNKTLDDYQEEQNKRKEKAYKLIEEFKSQKNSYDDMNRELQKLNNRRIELLNERWLQLHGELKNYSSDFLEQGFKYENGFLMISDDMKLVNEPPKLDSNNFSIDDLVMVHATDFFPENGVIKSNRDATGDMRNTVHTSLNGRVSSHMYGNWDKCPIVILDPLKEHIDQVECVYSVDTFTYGSVKLSPEALILINENKFFDFYQKNKDYIDANRDKVILYSGNSDLIVEELLSIMGYAPEKIDQWSWENKDDNNILDSYVNMNYPNKLNRPHDLTLYKYVENASRINEILNPYGFSYDGNDLIIDLDSLYALRVDNKKMPLEEFIVNNGVFVKDNEIHLLGIKDRIELLNNKMISPLQLKKIDMLIKKYELMESKKITEGHQR